MLPQQRVPEQRPEPLVLPARVRHHPIEVVEHAGDQMVGIALGAGQRLVDRQPVLSDEVGDDGVTVADRLSVIDDVGNWPRGAEEASKMCSCRKGTPASRRNANTFRP